MNLNDRVASVEAWCADRGGSAAHVARVAREVNYRRLAGEPLSEDLLGQVVSLQRWCDERSEARHIGSLFADLLDASAAAVA